jgi:hypothetical protein
MISGGFMKQELTGALSGLRRLELVDLQLYKDALNQVNRICWHQYFPYLYFRYEDLLITEVDGSVCVFYMLNQPNREPILYLYFLPMPMNEHALNLCLERVRAYNNSKKAVIYRVDEKDIGKLENLEADVRTIPLEKDYIYDPKIYRSLAGGEKYVLRRNLKKIMARDDVEVRAFEEGDIKDCLALMNEWAVTQEDKYDGHVAPRGFAKRCVRHSTLFDKKDLFGQVVLVGGKIRSVGFAGEIRTGLANLFITYSDHNISGLSRFQVYHLLLELEGYDLANYAYATTPGLIYAKESLCPVSKHAMYRVHVIK